jgi:hypothetical protein
VIWVRWERIYFCKWDWTTQITLIRFNKLAPRRGGYDAADLPVGQISAGWVRSSPVIARAIIRDLTEVAYPPIPRTTGRCVGVRYERTPSFTNWLLPV